ncbi:Roadblock/LC7 domain protein [Actinomadura rubteroloni]|uniref:Roadblock/LC7 domain protein n=2 Tax=Actinomadura rubteroloni TaxID=1926885 RepID=A0A2P4UKM6_9ACTN|nr:Roadblock/LC7 domain protein [Actinomadura rubteroloni]
MSDWTVEHMARVPGVRHVVLCTTDGLLKARSGGLARDDAERLAARCTAMLSLGRDQAASHGTGDPVVRQVMVQHDGGCLFLRGAAAGTALAVITGEDINPGLIAQEMQLMVLRLGEATLSTPSRGAGGVG